MDSKLRGSDIVKIRTGNLVSVARMHEVDVFPAFLSIFGGSFPSIERLQARKWDMQKLRHMEEQVAFVLRQAVTGAPVPEVIRRIGVLEQTSYLSKKLFGRLGASEIATDMLF